MTSETEQSAKTLVAESFFMSPLYEKRHVNEKTREGDEGRFTTWDNKWDSKDDFAKWLKENSLGGFSNLNLMNHNLRHYLIQGENGVLCELVSDVFEEKDVKWKGFREVWEGSYRRIVRIKYSPSTRSLPEELESELRARAYAQLLSDSDCAKRARDRFD